MAASRSVLVLVGPKGGGKTHVGALINKELGVGLIQFGGQVCYATNCIRADRSYSAGFM